MPLRVSTVALPIWGNGKVLERRAARKDVVGLAAIDIEAGGAQAPGFQSGYQGVAIHHVAARGVDDNGAFRQVGDVLGIEKISAFKK